MFSSTVRHSSRPSRCSMYPIRGEGPFTGSPNRRISPDVTGIRPAIRESSVLLPHPLGPTIATISPGVTARVIGPSACRSSAFGQIRFGHMIDFDRIDGCHGDSS